MSARGAKLTSQVTKQKWKIQCIYVTTDCKTGISKHAIEFVHSEGSEMYQ